MKGKNLQILWNVIKEMQNIKGAGYTYYEFLIKLKHEIKPKAEELAEKLQKLEDIRKQLDMEYCKREKGKPIYLTIYNEKDRPIGKRLEKALPGEYEEYDKKQKELIDQRDKIYEEEINLKIKTKIDKKIILEVSENDAWNGYFQDAISEFINGSN